MGWLAECFLCGRTDEEVALIPVRVKGEDRWVCVRCIPKLIHGG